MNGYNFMGSNSVIFIFPASLTVAVSNGKNLLPYELILYLTSCAPIETGKKRRKHMAVYPYRMIKNGVVSKVRKLNVDSTLVGFFHVVEYMLSYCVWTDDVRFYVLFSSFSVIAGQWMVANERLCTMESR